MLQQLSRRNLKRQHLSGVGVVSCIPSDLRSTSAIVQLESLLPYFKALSYLVSASCLALY